MIVMDIAYSFNNAQITPNSIPYSYLLSETFSLHRIVPSAFTQLLLGKKNISSEVPPSGKNSLEVIHIPELLIFFISASALIKLTAIPKIILFESRRINNPIDKTDESQFNYSMRAKCKGLCFLLLIIISGLISIKALSAETQVILDTKRCVYFYDDENGSSYITPDGQINSFSGFIENSLDNIGMSKGAEWLITDNGNLVLYYPGAGMNENIFLINAERRDLIQLTYSEYYYNHLDISPDYRTILFTRENYPEPEQLCYYILGALAPIVITEISSQSRFINNNQIVYEADNEIYIMNLYTGKKVLLLDLDSTEITIGNKIGDLSQSGKLILEPSYGDNSLPGYININNGRLTIFKTEAEFPEGNNYYFRWKPHSEELIFINRNNNNETLFWYSESSAPVIIQETSRNLFPLLWLSDRLHYAYLICDYQEWTKQGEEGIYFFNQNTFIIERVYDQMLYDYPPMACPYLYIYNGEVYIEYDEVLKNIVDERNEQTEYIVIPDIYIQGNSLRIQILEKLNETTYINSVQIRVNGEISRPVNCPPELTDIDDRYLILGQTEYIDLQFHVADEETSVSLEITGYYIPSR